MNERKAGDEVWTIDFQNNKPVRRIIEKIHYNTFYFNKEDGQLNVASSYLIENYTFNTENQAIEKLKLIIENDITHSKEIIKEKRKILRKLIRDEI